MSWPVFSSLRGYDRSWLRGDVVAGLTVWAVLVPEALAYATIAGVSPVVGLYAAPGALLLYAAFGSSRHLVTGPMSATAALSAAAVAELATAGSSQFVQLTAALAITTGMAAVLAGLLRLGFLAGFISEPVLKGFIIGLALSIVAGQLPKLFGVEGAGGTFFEKLWGLLGDLGDTSGLTLAVGLASLAVVLGLRRLAPVVPGSLVAVLAGIVAVQVFDLDAHGVAIVGKIDSGLPALGLPGVAAADYLALAPAAIGVMLVGFAEGWARPRRTRPSTTTRSMPTGSCWGWARPTSAPGCPAAWWSTAASPRRPSTGRPGPAPRCRGWSWPPSPSSPCCS